ncbi:MAG TPA: hypothetical protein VNV17_15460 [Solirubrobacteraceae bacterium]|jgi:hypothetical protein|nr:hypothetical protein [Solirubrobacteraceae bacterium]
MNTQSVPTQSPNRNLERRVQRMLGRRREPAALAAGQNDAATSPDRTDTRRPVSGARILRRWSVSDLIARAGGAPRAFA